MSDWGAWDFIGLYLSLIVFLYIVVTPIVHRYKDRSR